MDGELGLEEQMPTGRAGKTMPDRLRRTLPAGGAPVLTPRARLPHRAECRFPQGHSAPVTTTFRHSQCAGSTALG